MSRKRDFEKEIEAVKALKDKSQAEIDFKLKKIYEAQRRSLEKELDQINRALADYEARTNAQARLTQAAKDYTQATAKSTEKAIEDAVSQVARQTAESHVNAEQNLLRSAGAKPTPQARILAGNAVNSTVARTADGILKGWVYPDKYPLSQRIWGNSLAVQRDILNITMNGIQQGKSIADISDEIKRFVDPNAYKDWNKIMDDGFKVHRRNVEYNAQRLARTVSQHAYQQATEDMARQNPFITGLRWIANGSRPCPICQARDGTVYEVGQAPLDHPNGMCVLEPVIDERGMDDRLAAWVHGEEDQELSAWGRSLGYEA